MVMRKVLKFGTDGIRGHADEWPFLNDSLYVLGQALCRWVMQKNQSDQVSIMIGYDTRFSADRIKQALALGFSAQGKSTIIDVGVIPTPLLSWWMVQKSNIDMAIMISASHNPYYDNGIKIFGADGEKINEHDEQMILLYYEEIIKTMTLIPEQSHSASIAFSLEWKEAYFAWIKQHVEKNFWFDGTIVIDTAHGALSSVAADVLKQFVQRVVVMNAEPNGKNINEQAGALYPELLAQKVLEEKALLGFAFDGDGDRVMAVDEHGNIRDGDDMLYLLLSHPLFQSQRLVIGTIMSNVGFEQALQNRSIQLVRTPVGDKYIASALQKMGTLLGGEPSGHLIIKPYLTTGDGLFVAVKILETIVKKYASFDQSFVRFKQVHQVVKVSYKIPLEELSCYPMLQNLHQEISPGRMIVRYSGTEPVIRVTTEHADDFIANSINEQVVALLKNAF
jgi:phosphoglucosamine mutase